MKVHYMSKSNEWSTPQSFYDRLDKDFSFTLDPATDGANAKCKKFFTEQEDGLKQSWEGETVFMNPPYGSAIKDWIAKARKESENPNTIVVGLIPARTDTRYWHEHIFGVASDIIFIKGRLKFGDGENSAPFPSAVIVWGKGTNTRISTMPNYLNK